MRWSAALLAGLIASPALAAPPSLCALPGPTAITAGTSASPMPPVAASPIPSAAGPATPPPPVPAALAQIPFVRHVAGAGAAIIDLGESDRLHAFAARNGDQFMLFQVARDGEAAVSGAPIDLSLAQLESVAKGNITALGRLHGLDGYFVRSGQQFQVFYALPDGAHVIPGVLWDATGKDLTRGQVGHLPGVIPTVQVGGQNAAPLAALSLVRKARFGTIGPASAPHVYMLIDPQCIYSMRAFQMLRGYADAGRLRISVIPLAVLDYEDHGQSTRSALALLSDPADQIVSAWQSGSVANPPGPEAAALLRKNMAIAEAIGLKGTPTFIWRKADGTEGRLDGLPANAPAFVASIGS